MTLAEAMRREGLTCAHLTALRSLAVYGQLFRAAGENGWRTGGGCRVRKRVIEALKLKGLCASDRFADACPVVEITKTGREVLARIEGAAS